MSEDSVFDLSLAEKLQLVEDLWDDIALSSSEVPVLDWQKEEVALRRQRLLDTPASGISWQEMMKRVRDRNGS